MGPLRMSRTLAHAERTDEWSATDPVTSLGEFQSASKRALVHSLGDEATYFDVAKVIDDGLFIVLKADIGAYRPVERHV